MCGVRATVKDPVRMADRVADSPIKASANKNAILVFAFQTPQHFTVCQDDIPSQFSCDSIDSTDFPWIQRIFDGTSVFIYPCSQYARAKLTVE